jgi:hypothetical protein
MILDSRRVCWLSLLCVLGFLASNLDCERFPVVNQRCGLVVVAQHVIGCSELMAKKPVQMLPVEQLGWWPGWCGRD